MGGVAMAAPPIAAPGWPAPAPASPKVVVESGGDVRHNIGNDAPDAAQGNRGCDR
jgi:hypothetical protein